MNEMLFPGFSGLRRIPAKRAPHLPLVVAIHGGTYTSRYFDVPGYSLLDKAEANGIPIIAPDRPGYGQTPLIPPKQTTIEGQARFLTSALRSAWEKYGEGCRGIVLIGHSIGGAIAADIASAPNGLPIIGLAVSGFCLRTAEGDAERWSALPDVPLVEIPAEVKDSAMFGPEGSFDPLIRPKTCVAHAPANRGELIDIVTTWKDRVHNVLSRIAVPVHYRQAEIDHLWIVDQREIDAFAAALVQAPQVDAAMMRGTGHCMDFHYVGPALQLQQLGFALQCAAEAR
jgi:pimeloyl-ACP methyl ester carboxylesterase